MTAGAKCADCPFSRNGRPHGFVPAVGPTRPKGVMVGESPGSMEVEYNEPFVGLTGKELDAALDANGITRGSLRIINAIACKPVEPKTEKDMKKAADCCAPLFAYQLRGVPPRTPTIAMGKWAVYAVYGKHLPIVSRRGFPDLASQRIMTHHPTFAFFHEPYSRGAFLKDIEHFSRMMRGEGYAPMKLRINATERHLRDTLSEARRLGYVTLDIETAPEHPDMPWTGKDPTRARLRSVGLGFERAGISFMWEDATPGMVRVLREICASRDFVKVMHNGPWFDMRVLRRYEVPVRRWSDTRDMRRAQSSTSPLKLGYLASIYDYTNDWKHQEEEDAEEKGIVFTKDHKALMKYNAQDTVETARVYRGLRAETWGTRERRLRDVHYRLSVITSKMHDTGIYLHQRNRRFMLWCIEQKIAALRDELTAMVNVDGFEPTDDHMRAIIYKRHEWTKRVGGKRAGRDCRIARFGLDDPLNKRMYTDDDMETISVAEPALLLLIAGHDCPADLLPIIDKWWDLQAEKKRHGYLASRLIDEATGADGRLRPGWNSCGTDTMRFSCSQPNVMNIEQLLRHFLAPPPGRAIVHCDKSQLELRVMEVVADDEALYRALQTGDVYSFDALQWFALPPDTNVKKDAPKARQGCKIIHLASQYGAGVATVHTQALKQDRTFQFTKSRALNAAFKKTYHRTVSYWGEEMARVMAQGYSERRLLQGRRVYPAPPELSEVVNYPIQGTAGEMMNLEVIELDRRLREVPSARLIIQLHDATDVECDADDVPRVKALMQEVHDREWTIDGRTRRFPVEIKVTYAQGCGPTPWYDGTWYDV